MVKLVDTQSSDGCIRKDVWVQIPSLAPSHLTNEMRLVNWGAKPPSHLTNEMRLVNWGAKPPSHLTNEMRIVN